MNQTRQQKAKKLLQSGGFHCANVMPDSVFGTDVERNRAVTQDVIFDNMTLRQAGDRHGLSRERVRQIGLVATRRLCKRYE